MTDAHTSEKRQPDARLIALIEDLRALPAETSWVEFKHNNADPKMIGKLISALSNAARLADQHFAYVLWGIGDGDHAIVGTAFEPTTQKESGQPLELWLAQRLQPALAFTFRSIEHGGQRLVLLEIPAAAPTPVEFERLSYIRIGSATPLLSEHPERLRALWAKLQPYAWETGIAAQFQTSDEVLAKLDYASYFDLTGQPLPDNRNGIFDKLAADRLIQPDVGAHWNITNLGALLFAKQLGDFPAIAIRELVANALIHQDMTITGTGPLIELFKDRLEITNPGQPLVSPERFLDSPPRSRNEALASLMRRMRLCEEQGTGIDKVLAAVELHQLPPPDFRVEGQAVRVVLFAPRRFADMTQDERVRACYQHAALKFVSGQWMKNSSLRERLGISEKNAAQASTVIKHTLDANLIRPADSNHPRAGYVPFWA